ncbi:MAG: hypothetical protein KTR24_07785 [Saprospiraceae bacterium]|nr:hypothetical protein [Saprospiraceae bacterium]
MLIFDAPSIWLKKDLRSDKELVYLDMTLSKRIALPLILLLAALGIHVYVFDHPQHSIWLVVPVLLLAMLYMVHPELDRRWRERNPQRLPSGMIVFLERFLPGYPLLNAEQRGSLHKELDLYLQHVEFLPQGFSEIAEEFKAAVCAHMALLHAIDHQSATAIADIGKIAVYRHPFPSPRYPKHLHASELHRHDGIAIFSATHAVEGYHKPQEYPNLILYEFAKLVGLPEMGQKAHDHDALSRVSGFAVDRLTAHLGLPLEEIDLHALMLTYYFQFRSAFMKHFPEIGGGLDAHFGFNPNTSLPY